MSTINNSAFQISGGASSTTSIAVTASSQQLTLPACEASGNTCVLTVTGSQTIFLSYGSVTASLTTSMPILAGTQTTLAIPPGVAQISVIAAGVGSTLYATIGNGI